MSKIAYYIIVITFSLIIFNFSFAGDKINNDDKTQIRNYINLFNKYKHTCADSALYYGIKAFDIFYNHSVLSDSGSFIKKTSRYKADKQRDTLQDLFYIKQNNKLFIYTILDSLGYYYLRKRDFTKALKFFQEIIKNKNDANTSLLQSAIKGKANCLFSIGVEYDFRNNYDKAIEYYRNSLTEFESINDYTGIAKCFSKIGIYYIKVGNFDYGTMYMYKSLRLREKNDDKIGVADCYLNIGNIFNEIEDDSTALKYYFFSLKMYKDLNEKAKTGNCYQNIGNVFSDLFNYDKAIKYYNMALKIHESEENKVGMEEVLNNLGNTYLNKSEFVKALEFYQKAITVTDKKDFGITQAMIYNNLAILQLRHNNYAQAIEYAEESLRICKNINALQRNNTSYLILKEAYYKTGNYKKASEYADLCLITKDSILNINKNKQIIEIRTKYETEKKEKEIEMQALKISQQELMLNRNKAAIIIFILVILLTFTFGWIMFLQFRTKQTNKHRAEMLKQQRLRTTAIIETQEQERKRIAQDLHDGIGHKLTTLKIYFEEIDEALNKVPENIRNILHKIENILDDTHKEVRTLSHQMMPKALQENEFNGAISDLISQSFAESKIKCYLRNDLNADLPENIRICLYRVLQELLNNSVKHARPNEISVSIFKNKENLIMMVEDDGKGFKMNDKNEYGIGLNNIAGRVNAVNGTFHIEQGHLNGAIAIIKIPLTL